MSKKRKIDLQGRVFYERWENKYLFVLKGEKPVRLLCSGTVSVYSKFSLQEKLKIAAELTGRLQLQQNLFTKATDKNDAAVKASFIVAEEIIRCMLKVCEQVCLDKVKSFQNVTEEIDNVDSVHLSVFIRGVNPDLSVTKELLDIVAMHGTTTGRDIFDAVEKSVNSAPAMFGGKTGLTSLITYHCIIHQEALCGKVLETFIRSQGLNHSQLQLFLQEVGSEHEEMPFLNFEKKLIFHQEQTKTLVRHDHSFPAHSLHMEVPGGTNTLVHFPACQIISASAPGAFTCALKYLHSGFDIFANPFTARVCSASHRLQMELIELQSNSGLTVIKTRNMTLLPSTATDLIPQLRLHAARVLSMFGIHTVLWIATAQELKPDINKLTSGKPCQTSGQKT
uniref:DUF4371 domain-containing protein n=1 Tax=Xiphophorus maculatus TaxID=8083 RepID=A0A3B5QKV8_XIPMA